MRKQSSHFELLKNTLSNIPITKKLIGMCGGAHQIYVEYLRLKNEQELKEKAVAKAQEEASASKEKKEKRKEMANELHFILTAVSIAEKSIAEENQEFHTCMKESILNRKKLEQARAKIDMGLKRKAELQSHL